MKTLKTLISGFAAGAAMIFGAATLPLVMPSAMVEKAHAADSKTIVDAAKVAGTVGERIDGYLGVVTSASKDVEEAVKDINIRRRSVYTRLADEQGQSITVVAALSGEKLTARAAAGTKIMTGSGAWVTK